MTLTTDWSPFDGDYKKKMQDLQLHDGTVITKCWPNAGKFLCFSDNDQKDIALDQVAFVRLTHAPEWEGQEEDEQEERKFRPVVIAGDGHIGIAHHVAEALAREGFNSQAIKVISPEELKGLPADDLNHVVAFDEVARFPLTNVYEDAIKAFPYGEEKKKKKPCTFHEYVKKGEEQTDLGTTREIWKCRHCNHPL